VPLHLRLPACPTIHNSGKVNGLRTPHSHGAEPEQLEPSTRNNASKGGQHPKCREALISTTAASAHAMLRSDPTSTIS